MLRWEEGLEELLSDYVHLLKAGVRICDWKSWTMWRRINLLAVTNQRAEKTKKTSARFSDFVPPTTVLCLLTFVYVQLHPFVHDLTTLNFTLNFITFITAIFVNLVTIVFQSSILPLVFAKQQTKSRQACSEY